MPKAVVFGAGNIGRGFLGQIFAESGYDLVFIEANRELVASLNRCRKYPISLVSEAGDKEFMVEGVRAVDCEDAAAVRELAEADLAATAVGVNALAGVAPLIARACLLRAELTPGRPLDVIICENLLGAERYLRIEVEKHLPASLSANLGLVEASIGRMVPLVTPERRALDPLRVWAEPYCELPVDADGFRGPIPRLAHLLPCRPFDYYIQRKLYLHNAGHAIAAYLGHAAGFRLIGEAMADPAIRRDVETGMHESARALSLEHGIPLRDVLDHAADLRRRFADRALGDTVARVGRDPWRKLQPDDRLVGAARLIVKHGGTPRIMAKAIAAGLRFMAPGDKGAERLQDAIRLGGLERALVEICGLAPAESLTAMVRRYYRAFESARRATSAAAATP
ncbi:MAG: mannitol dehydrogenase [Patescibacteria group bacterium]